MAETNRILSSYIPHRKQKTVNMQYTGTKRLLANCNCFRGGGRYTVPRSLTMDPLVITSSCAQLSSSRHFKAPSSFARGASMWQLPAEATLRESLRREQLRVHARHPRSATLRVCVQITQKQLSGYSFPSLLASPKTASSEQGSSKREEDDVATRTAADCMPVCAF